MKKRVGRLYPSPPPPPARRFVDNNLPAPEVRTLSYEIFIFSRSPRNSTRTIAHGSGVGFSASEREWTGKRFATIIYIIYIFYLHTTISFGPKTRKRPSHYIYSVWPVRRSVLWRGGRYNDERRSRFDESIRNALKTLFLSLTRTFFFLFPYIHHYIILVVFSF